MGQADAPDLHPDPPHDLARRHLPLRTLHTEWHRVYRCARDPRFFGRTGQFRFDAPGAEYGVLYMARSHEGAFIETFGSVIRARRAQLYRRADRAGTMLGAGHLGAALTTGRPDRAGPGAHRR